MGRKRAQMDVTLKLLLDAGDVRPGIGVLHVSTRDQTRHADLHSDGIISFEGVRHRSLSSFAVAAIRSCGAVGRKTANGWQVVSYRGRPLEQYRADFLEKQSQDSDSSREAERVIAKAAAKKRRMSSRLTPDGDGLKGVYCRETGSEMEDAVRSTDSGGSRASSTEVAPIKKPMWTRTFTQRRLRPSRTWMDLFPLETKAPHLAQRVEKPRNGVFYVDARCGMKIEKTPSTKQGMSEEEEEDVKQQHEVHMWLKKALNKRHREECGMS